MAAAAEGLAVQVHAAALASTETEPVETAGQRRKSNGGSGGRSCGTDLDGGRKVTRTAASRMGRNRKVTRTAASRKETNRSGNGAAASLMEMNRSGNGHLRCRGCCDAEAAADRRDADVVAGDRSELSARRAEGLETDRSCLRRDEDGDDGTAARRDEDDGDGDFHGWAAAAAAAAAKMKNPSSDTM
ncbi:hypothetical protein Csa_014984 [Cucumis sativus]|nr:hypothetical protein Csa_014984 [Cucumis sativus]